MVNYQGPEVLRGAFEMAKIPVFDRVNRISYLFRDLSAIHLEKTDVARLQRMKGISIKSRGAQHVEKADVEAAEEIVPVCRLVSLAASADQIEVEMSPASVFACSAP